MKNALIYARVSTDEQAREGQSIESQIKLCSDYAKQHSIVVLESITDEGKSGSNTNRPGLQSLLTKISDDKTINIVLVQDTDRLARNTLDHLSIKAFMAKHNVQLISISQPMIDDSPEGHIVDTIIASVNTFFSQITGRKTSKVMEEKIKAGWWANYAPPGYKNITNPHPTSSHDKRIIVPDPEVAPVIQRIFEYYATGQYTLKTLAQKMQAQGLQSRKAIKIHPSMIANILNHRIYYGEIAWKGQIYLGKHEPLVSRELWDRCQSMLANHNQNGSRTRKHNYLLRGFIFCGICGSRFWAEQHKKPTTIVEAYFCSQCKRGTYVNKNELEKQVESLFKVIEVTEKYTKELHEAAKRIIEESRKSRYSEVQSIINQKTQIEKKITNAEDSLLDGTFPKEQYQRVMQRLNADLQEIEKALREASGEYQKKFDSIKQLVSMARNIQKTYIDADPDLKRHYLSLFFEKIIVKEGKITEALPSADLKPMIRNGKIRVRVKTNWLPR